MKYIRTKNEIRKTEGLTLVEDERFGRRYLNQYNFPYIPIKEADTVEELCDEFVGYVGEEYVKENKTYGMPNFQEYNLEDMLYHMSYTKEDCVVYGAIWTSKGLIYVAKMNESGELELIWQK